MVKIIENGVEMELTQKSADKLVSLNLIYKSEEPCFYHITDGKTWKDIDKEIN